VKKERVNLLKIYLVRHGITKTNKEKRYVGWGDVDLSSQGLRQAERAAEWFSTHRIAGLYSSDLRRAIKTAEAIGKCHGLVPSESSLLREMNFGKWEGLTHNEISASYDQDVNTWINNPFHNAPTDGETLLDVCKRMQRFLEDISSRYKEGDKVVVVSHGGPIRSILHYYMGLEPEQLWGLHVDNASVSLLEKYEVGYKANLVNSIEHLKSDDAEEC
jgi:alpha-ribazole phosphatase